MDSRRVNSNHVSYVFHSTFFLQIIDIIVVREILVPGFLETGLPKLARFEVGTIRQTTFTTNRIGKNTLQHISN